MRHAEMRCRAVGHHVKLRHRIYVLDPTPEAPGACEHRAGLQPHLQKSWFLCKIHCKSCSRLWQPHACVPGTLQLCRNSMHALPEQGQMPHASHMEPYTHAPCCIDLQLCAQARTAFGSALAALDSRAACSEHGLAISAPHLLICWRTLTWSNHWLHKHVPCAAVC